MRADGRGADGLLELGHREEDADETTDDEVVDLLFDVGEAVRDGAGRDDGEVVADLLVVEDAAAGGIDPAGAQRFLGEDAGRVRSLEGLQGSLGVGQVILREILGVGSRVGQRLVLLVKGLGDAEGSLGREAETTITFSLEGREVEEARGAFLLGLAFVGDDADAELERLFGHLAGLGFVVEAFGFLAVGHAGDLGGAAVAPLGDTEVSFDLPKGLGYEITDLELALDDQHERRGLHASDREDLALGSTDADRPSAAAVHADQPVSLGAADRGTQEAGLGRLGEQVGEGFGNRRIGHAGQPEPANRQLAAGELVDVVEDELAFAAGIARIDNRSDVLATKELLEEFVAVAVVALADHYLQDVRAGRAVELLGQHWQVFQHPALPLWVEILGVL